MLVVCAYLEHVFGEEGVFLHDLSFALVERVRGVQGSLKKETIIIIMLKKKKSDMKNM